MTRVEEYEYAMKEIATMIESGGDTFLERQTKIQSAMLTDIAKSLAVIADALTEGKELKNESTGNIR